MKIKNTFSILVVLAVINIGCSRTTTDVQSTSTEPESVPVDVEQNDSPEQFKFEKNMVNINTLEGNYTVKVGQQLVYSANIHGSVGKSASAQSSNQKDLPLSKRFVEYKNKQREGMTGADAATAYFIFDVKEVGSYEILVQKHFRGDLESEHTIEITAEAAD